MNTDNTKGRKKTLSNSSRYYNAAKELNAGAYKMLNSDEYKAKKATIKSMVFRLFPCPKSGILNHAIFIDDSDTPISVVEKDVLLTDCDCHPNLTLDELRSMEFNEVK